jgi:hypothetical protein
VINRHGRNERVERLEIAAITDAPETNPQGLDRRAPRPTTIPAVAGIGAGAIHAAAIGAHADHLLLANAFVVLAMAQLVTGIALLTQPGRVSAKAAIVVNAGALVGWLVSRLVGVWFIAGLEVAEPPEFTDTVCASLSALVIAGAAFALQADNRLGPTRRWRPAITVRDLALPAVAVILVTVPAMSQAATHSHAVEGDDAHSHDIVNDDATTTVDVDPEDG